LNHLGILSRSPTPLSSQRAAPQGGAWGLWSWT